MQISEAAHPTKNADAQPRELLSWTVHMARRDPYRLIPVCGSAAFAAVTAWIIFRNPIFSLAALFMIASATAEYWLPAHYRLTDKGAECRYGANRLEIEWSAVKRALLYDDGLRLSPLPTASRLDAFRGVYLRFGADGEPGERDGVLAILNDYRNAARTGGEA